MPLEVQVSPKTFQAKPRIQIRNISGTVTWSAPNETEVMLIR
jgi:hypothetical protein